MAFLKRHRDLLAFLLVVVVFGYALNDAAENTSQGLYENSIAACERGNILREVVYANTLAAVKQEPNAGFEEQLRLMRSTPGRNIQDGTVDCSVVVHEP